MAAADLLLGLDGGQTATKALLADRDGRILAAGRDGSADHLHAAGGEAKNRTAIHGAIDAVLMAAGAGREAVSVVALGWTGAVAGGLQIPLVERIVREKVAPRQVVVAPDYVTNLAGASKGSPGVVVIAGGGAIADGVTDDAREAVAGGFGYLLGDEGSAFDIGRRAIAAAARASDGRVPATAVEPLVAAAFGIDALAEVTGVVYAARFLREGISLLAPLVTAAARDGDAVASGIVTTAAADLAASALAVAGRLHLPAEPISIYPTGGVFASGEVLLAPFRTAITDAWPRAAVRAPAHAPAAGALFLAARAEGIEPGGTWWENVAETEA